MSVQIPINGSSTPASESRGVRIPLGTILPVGLFGTSREEKVVRAVAAAAALHDPAEALKLAQQAVDDFSTVAGNVIDRTALDPVLEKVTIVLDAGGGPQPTAEQTAAAKEVDVDAALVAVAQAALQFDEKRPAEARKWVADIEPALLDPVARVVVRQQKVNFIPKVAGTAGTVESSRLDDIERRLKALEDAQKTADAAAKATT
jgi:hypothetical protein